MPQPEIKTIGEVCAVVDVGNVRVMQPIWAAQGDVSDSLTFDISHEQLGFRLSHGDTVLEIPRTGQWVHRRVAIVFQSRAVGTIARRPS